jgi:hypothetical protein
MFAACAMRQQRDIGNFGQVPEAYAGVTARKLATSFLVC